MSVKERFGKVDLVFVHLFDGFSGSPKVLHESISVSISENIPSCLYLGSGGQGVLSTEAILPVKRYWYKRYKSKFATLLSLLLSQIFLFFKLLFDRRLSADSIIYVNALLPFGASIFGALSGKKVIYHIHETSIEPKIFMSFLLWVNKLTSDLNIFVSDNHLEAFPSSKIPSLRIYNGLGRNILRQAATHQYQHFVANSFHVVLLANLRDYKGVPEFLDLAARFADRKEIIFDLVANEEDQSAYEYLEHFDITPNVTLHSRVDDPAKFYKLASIVVNLSRPDLCVETFGLTILEAMAFGVPVIVPPVGGPAELVQGGVHGYLIDSRHTEELENSVSTLLADKDLCFQMSKAGRLRAADFSPQRYVENLRKILR